MLAGVKWFFGLPRLVRFNAAIAIGQGCKVRMNVPSSFRRPRAFNARLTPTVFFAMSTSDHYRHRLLPAALASCGGGEPAMCQSTAS